MEYSPKQLEIFMHKVSFTLENRLQDLTKQQDGIMENRLDPILARHHGQAESITSNEIEGAYEIAMLHIYIPPLELVQKSEVLDKQGQTSKNKDNNFSNMCTNKYCRFSPNMACFCKLKAQNWHKNSTLVMTK